MSGPFGSSQWMYNAGSSFYPVQIDDSLRFEDGSSAYLNRTPSAGNRRTWTWSGWVKRSNIDINSFIFGCGSSSTNFAFIGFDSANKIDIRDYQGSYTYSSKTSQLFRDTSAWYHLVLTADMNNSTAADRIKLYVNGERVTSFNSAPSPTTKDLVTNSAIQHVIGAGYYNDGSGLNSYFDGYLSNIHFIDGTALDPTSFGETKDGTWIPKSYSGSYGTNGFHLEFNSNTNDTSGNGNNWTANNISAHDYVPDTPTNNWCTLNSIYGNGDSISEGNLKGEGDSGSAVFQGWTSTFAMSSGKWYWEVNALDVNSIMQIGVHPTGAAIDTSTNLSYHTDAMIYNNGGTKAIGTGGLGDAPTTKTTTSYGASYTDGDIIGVALDLDSGTTTLTFYKNNSSQGAAFSNLASDEYTALYTGISNSFGIFNFGQDSSFAGTKTSGSAGASDANGNGDFYYAPPSGFLALCTANLTEPTIIDASEYFNTLLWTGNGSNPRTLSGLDFAADFIWHKSRSNASMSSHAIQDSVRGFNTNNNLYTNLTGSETAYPNRGVINSVSSTGFTFNQNASDYSTADGLNENNQTFVAWCWKAGTAFSNSAGSNGATIASSGSVNTDAGFSIVSWTGNGTSGATVGHGLGVTPDMVIVKNRTTSGTNWPVFHSSQGTGSNGYLDITNSWASGSTWGSSQTFNSTVFSVGSQNYVNNSDDNMIAYCFADVEGYSKAGSYIGNYNVDGPFVYTGFRPAFIIIKSAVTSGYSWYMMDSKRTAYNGSQAWLSPDQTLQEDTSTGENVDILSNGFKIRTNWTRLNDSGSPTYIYLAFAENPFKYSNAR